MSFPPKLILAISLVLAVAAIAAADKVSENQRRWAQMVRTETAIREIDLLLQRLEKSVLELQLPSSATRQHFATKVSVANCSMPELSVSDMAVLGTTTQDSIIGAPRSELRARLKLWTSFLQRVSYLTSADFKIIDGQFEEQDDLRFNAQVSFSALGRSDQGFVHGLAKLNLKLQRASSKSEWKISGWHTTAFKTTIRAGLMFEEVLDRSVTAEVAAELRRSLHEEASAEVLLAQIEKDRGKSAGAVKRPFPTFDFSSWTRHPSVSVVDYDNDGFDDLFITRRTGANTMLHNRGDGTFEDTTLQARLTTDWEQPGFSNAALFADFDNDGDQDAFIARSLYRSCYYENENGVFRNSPESLGVDLPAHVVSISAVDYNRDGLLDVYLSRYMPVRNGFNVDITKLSSREAVAKLYQVNRKRLPRNEAQEFARRTWEAQQDFFRDAPGLPNLLLRNVGNGEFEVAPEGKALQAWRPTYQATWADFDSDGDSDVYLANDFSPNHLFRNDGKKFTDITSESESADNGFGMGATWGDYDGDGQLDLYVTNMFSKAGRRITKALGDAGLDFAPMARGNSLFRQQNGKFQRVSGTTSGTMPVEAAGWGWGSQFVDVDNDGLLDIFAPAGYYTAPPQVRRSIDT